MAGVVHGLVEAFDYDVRILTAVQGSAFGECNPNAVLEQVVLRVLLVQVYRRVLGLRVIIT